MSGTDTHGAELIFLRSSLVVRARAELRRRPEINLDIHRHEIRAVDESCFSIDWPHRVNHRPSNFKGSVMDCRRQLLESIFGICAAELKTSRNKTKMRIIRTVSLITR